MEIYTGFTLKLTKVLYFCTQESRLGLCEMPPVSHGLCPMGVMSHRCYAPIGVVSHGCYAPIGVVFHWCCVPWVLCHLSRGASRNLMGISHLSIIGLSDEAQKNQV